MIKLNLRSYIVSIICLCFFIIVPLWLSFQEPDGNPISIVALIILVASGAWVCGALFMLTLIEDFVLNQIKISGPKE